MDTVFAQYERLVYHIANQYQFGGDKEDLYQAGLLGLKKALLHYDPKKESDMVSYVGLYIKGEILKEINNNKELLLSRETYQLQKEVKKAEEELTQALGRKPQTKEIAYYLSEPLEKISQIEVLMQPIYHLDQENQDDMCLYQKISHIEKSYDANIMDLHSAYEALEEEEKKLITSRYYEDKTQQETASLMGMSQVQVSRNEKKILSKMRVTLTTISL